jgi:hypothetical protein
MLMGVTGRDLITYSGEKRGEKLLLGIVKTVKGMETKAAARYARGLETHSHKKVCKRGRYVKRLTFELHPQQRVAAVSSQVVRFSQRGF